MRTSLTAFVFLATLVGAIFGLCCHAWLHDPAALADINQALTLVTTIFLRAIKMLVAPLVITTLVSGIGRMGDSGEVGRIGLLALSWFIAASLVALALGLVMVETIAPGAGLHLTANAGASSGIAASPMTLVSFLTDLVPTSIFDAMAQNQVLQIVVFSVVAGLALTRLGKQGAGLVELSSRMADLVLKMAMLVMWTLAPIAVFAAVAVAFIQNGTEVIARYASYVGGFYLALVLLWAMLMAAGAAVLGVAGQIKLMKAVREPALIALATTSSEAAYPVLLFKLEQIGVPGRIASFVLPLGYSFNLIGSMCYCTFAALFIAQAFDITMSPGEIARLLFLVFVASKGIANVPRASMVVVVSLLPYFHLPEAGALLILGVDHFLDMGRTCTNTVATAIAAASVAKWDSRKETA